MRCMALAQGPARHHAWGEFLFARDDSDDDDSDDQLTTQTLNDTKSLEKHGRYF